jgi:hypothetical protein
MIEQVHGRARAWGVVVGEIEFEIGAMLRNPIAHPATFVAPAAFARRMSPMTAPLELARGIRDAIRN